MTPTPEVAHPTIQEAPEALVPETHPARRTPEEALAEIRRDALETPLRYLEEVTVPFGGE